MSVLYKILKVSSGTNYLHNLNVPIPFDISLYKVVSSVSISIKFHGR